MVDEFEEKNTEELNEIISDLEMLVSEDALENIALAFDKSLNKSLQKISDDIDMDVELTEEYFTHYFKTMNDNDYLLELLKNYNIENIDKIKYVSGSKKEFKKFLDEIYRKERTSAYSSKYNSFLSTWDHNKNYLKKQLYIEILADYKQVYNKIKELLQNVVKLGNLQNYTDLEELEFYKTHTEIIETLQSRIDKYFSEEIFDSKYSKIIEQIKTEKTKVVDNENKFISTKHTAIYKLSYITNYTHDFCI